MSDYVTRIARAVDAERIKQFDAGDPYAEDATAIARAALEAAMEPDEAMIEAGMQSGPMIVREHYANHPFGTISSLSTTACGRIFRAMIKQALEGK